MAAASLAVGKKAPGFALKNQDDKTVKLGHFSEKWVVLYFYPEGRHPRLHRRGLRLHLRAQGFREAGRGGAGLQPRLDREPPAFIAKHKLKIGLLSDPDHQTMDDYGAWGEKNMYGRITLGVIRSTVIIDPEGKVVYHWPKVSANGHAEEVQEVLKDVQAKAKTKKSDNRGSDPSPFPARGHWGTREPTGLSSGLFPRPGAGEGRGEGRCAPLPQVLRGEVPVDEVRQERVDVFGAGVAVVDVVGVLPDVDGEQGLRLCFIGRSALAVLVTFSLPPSSTSQAQPEPNWVLPASANCCSRLSSDPKSRLIASASLPVGLPLPPGFIEFQ